MFPRTPTLRFIVGKLAGRELRETRCRHTAFVSEFHSLRVEFQDAKTACQRVAHRTRRASMNVLCKTLSTHSRGHPSIGFRRPQKQGNILDLWLPGARRMPKRKIFPHVRIRLPASPVRDEKWYS
eukprot:1178745-Prorocentrum_minimum.AAC.3